MDTKIEQFLRSDDFAGYRTRGDRMILLAYSKPSPVHGGPTPADLPHLWPDDIAALSAELRQLLVPAA